MSKKIRDLLFIFFIVAYIIMATVICLFASGYKFNISWPLQFDRLLVKTGTLSITTSPKDAYIFLNNTVMRTPIFHPYQRPWKIIFEKWPKRSRDLFPADPTRLS